MTVKKCDMCKGSKKTKGLGMIIKECPKCSGIGYTTIGESIVLPVSDQIVEPVKRKRRTVGTTGADMIVPDIMDVQDDDREHCQICDDSSEMVSIDTSDDVVAIDIKKTRKKLGPNKNVLVGFRDAGGS